MSNYAQLGIVVKYQNIAGVNVGVFFDPGASMLIT